MMIVPLSLDLLYVLGSLTVMAIQENRGQCGAEFGNCFHHLVDASRSDGFHLEPDRSHLDARDKSSN